MSEPNFDLDGGKENVNFGFAWPAALGCSSLGIVLSDTSRRLQKK